MVLQRRMACRFRESRSRLLALDARLPPYWLTALLPRPTLFFTLSLACALSHPYTLLAHLQPPAFLRLLTTIISLSAPPRRPPCL